MAGNLCGAVRRGWATQDCDGEAMQPRVADESCCARNPLPLPTLARFGFELHISGEQFVLLSLFHLNNSKFNFTLYFLCHYV
jgi:hypothetical protein